MRFNLLARRNALVPTLALALALTAAACSSSSSTSASNSGSSAPAASSPAAGGSSSAPGSATASSPGTGSTSGAAAQITANWEKFFNSSTPISQKVTLLQNGSTFETAIKDFANFPLASNVGAKVTAVVVNSATSATVSYNITLSGTTALPNQTGVSVYQNGTWKVGDASLCALFKLVPGGTVPAVCNSAG